MIGWWIYTHQKLFVEFGGVLLDHHCVTEIIPGDTVTVKTDKREFRAKKIVITAGPWAPKIMEKLGIQLPFKVGHFIWILDAVASLV